MSRLWWVSWIQGEEAGPNEWPPPVEVLAFWETGATVSATGHRAVTVVALVSADVVHEATDVVEAAWSDGFKDWRFADPYPDAATPPDNRYPPPSWSLSLQRWPWKA